MSTLNVDIRIEVFTLVPLYLGRSATERLLPVAQTMFSKLFKSHKEDEPLKPFQGDLEGLWYLEGKAYDLTKFVKMHPGKHGA